MWTADARVRLTPPEGRACLAGGVDSGWTGRGHRAVFRGRWLELALLGRYHRLLCAHGQREEKD